MSGEATGGKDTGDKTKIANKQFLTSAADLLADEILGGLPEGDTAGKGDKGAATPENKAAATAPAEIDITQATPEQKQARLAEITTERAALEKQLAAAEEDKKAEVRAQLDALEDEEAGINGAGRDAGEVWKQEKAALEQSVTTVTQERDALKARVAELEKAKAPSEDVLAAVAGDPIFALDETALEQREAWLEEAVAYIEDKLAAGGDHEEDDGKGGTTTFTPEQLRQHLRHHQRNLKLIPKAREIAAQRRAAADEARAKWPDFFNTAHADATALKALETELPWLAAHPRKYHLAAELLVGRKALAATKTAAAPQKRTVVPKTVMRAPATGGGKPPAADKGGEKKGLVDLIMPD